MRVQTRVVGDGSHHTISAMKIEVLCALKGLVHFSTLRRSTIWAKMTAYDQVRVRVRVKG